MQSMELSGISPRGGIFPGMHDGGSMLLMLGDGSTFSQSSILSAKPSQLIWKRVTRGLEANIFLWSWENKAVGKIKPTIYNNVYISDQFCFS